MISYVLYLNVKENINIFFNIKWVFILKRKTLTQKAKFSIYIALVFMRRSISYLRTFHCVFALGVREASLIYEAAFSTNLVLDVSIHSRINYLPFNKSPVMVREACMVHEVTFLSYSLFFFLLW